ncbi:hypothetical protein FACS1894208_00810 [Clostridia bacterium]|nr:hypothetical protein FACS1894208_00810 [Clostridia bacterium]
MAGLSLDNLVPQGDMDTLRALDRQTHEPGYEVPGGGESLADMGFASYNDMSQPTQGSPIAGQDFQNSLQTQQADVPQQQDLGMEAAKAALKGGKSLLTLLIEVCKSVETRTADDWGFFGNRAIIGGGIFAVLGVLLLILAGTTGATGFGFKGLGGACLWAGILGAGVGTGLMGFAYNAASKAPQHPEEALLALTEPPDPETEAYVNNIEESMENIVPEDLLAELNDILDDADYGDPISETQTDFEKADPVLDIPNFDELDKQIAQQKRVVTRAGLLDAFLPYFMKKTPQFRESVELSTDSPQFESLRAVCVKALANLQNIPIEKVAEKLLSARETFFSYKLVFERVMKLKKTADLEHELETYFRSTINDPRLSEEDIRKQRLRIKATVEASADTWEITINKGVSGIITVGDCLAGQRELDFYKSEKNALPIIAGITESGSVILEDAQYLDNMMITGKQRSGKSWYVNALLTSLVAFNSPEEVALIVIDPKNSTMFSTLALFPHVVGIHDGANIVDIFREVIDVEAVRRAEKLRESRCENIKDYNAEHPEAKMPRLYIVIDEVISVRDGLMQQGSEKEGKQKLKEFNSSMLTIMSKLPYVGIGLIFIPHRSTGIVEKTARALLKLKAAVMADEAEIVETLDEKIDRRLTAAGDIAMRTASMESARYVRGPAVADDDRKTTETLRRLAKGFYSMGCEVPKWGHLEHSYVSNDTRVRTELFGDTQTVQH